LMGYVLMISRIARTTAGALVLEPNHQPDWLRGPEIIGVIVLALLFIALKRGLAGWNDPLVLLVLSLSLHLFLLFNQQVLTGRSLQPFHYEVFIGNYSALLSLVLTFVIFRRGRHGAMRRISLLSQRAFFWLCVLSFVWGEMESRFNILNFRRHNLERDAFLPVTRRLNDPAVTGGRKTHEREVLFSPDVYIISDQTPGFAPQAVLWGTYAFFMPTLSEEQRQERFFRQLYYSGMSPEKLAQRLREGYHQEIAGLFGFERLFRNHAVHFKPIRAEEINARVAQYADFVRSFDAHRAVHPTLSWVVIPENVQMDASNLDQWYIRETAERIGPFTLYRVRPRLDGVDADLTRTHQLEKAEKEGTR
jgi:hypothetical protein